MLFDCEYSAEAAVGDEESSGICALKIQQTDQHPGGDDSDAAPREPRRLSSIHCAPLLRGVLLRAMCKAAHGPKAFAEY